MEELFAYHVVTENQWLNDKLLRNIIQMNWNIPCEMIKKIAGNVWNIDDRYIVKKYDNERELQRNIILMKTLGECNLEES